MGVGEGHLDRVRGEGAGLQGVWGGGRGIVAGVETRAICQDYTGSSAVILYCRVGCLCSVVPASLADTIFHVFFVLTLPSAVIWHDGGCVGLRVPNPPRIWRGGRVGGGGGAGVRGVGW